MYNILFSITAHENFDFLLLQIKNILQYNNNCAIIIRLSIFLHLLKRKMKQKQKREFSIFYIVKLWI